MAFCIALLIVHCSQTMKFSTFALLATAITGTVASRPGSSLRFEHPGRVFSKSHSQGCCVQGVVHDEEPRGHLEEYNDGGLLLTPFVVESHDVELTIWVFRDTVHHIAASPLWRPTRHGRFRSHYLPD